MAYKTGVSGSVTELIAAIKSFAAENGFASGTQWTAGVDATVTYVSKNGNFFFFAWNNTLLHMDVATGSNGSGLPNTQPGAMGNFPGGQVGTFVYPIAGPHVGYHLFCDGDRIHVAVELVTNVFAHLSFGMIRKAGSWTGGAYCTANRWNYADFGDGKIQPYSTYFHQRIFDGLQSYAARNLNWQGAQFNAAGLMQAPYQSLQAAMEQEGPGANSYYNSICWSHLSWGNELIEDSPNSFNSRAVLVPMQVTLASVINTSTPPFRLELGQVPSAAAINMANINPKDLVNTDWMVFPLSQKNGPGLLYVNTLNNGIAYKK